MSIQHSPTDFFGRVLDRFPSHGRSLCFAYGSGVFRQVRDCVCLFLSRDVRNFSLRTLQAGQKTSDNVTDLMFIVEDSREWHRQNVRDNKSDYSGEPGSHVESPMLVLNAVLIVHRRVL